MESMRRPLQLVKDVLRLREPTVKNLALDWGLLPGHSDYTKFIVLGRSRTGSNLLRGLLNAHSRIVTLGEIFRNPDAVEWGMSHYPQSQSVVALYQTNPAKFLETQVFRKWPRPIQAFGFKLFYYHAAAGPRSAIWAYLQNRLDLKVIHIKRRNMLRTHLSRARAARNDTWVNLSGQREDETPLELDYTACLNDFVQTRKWEQDYDAFFQHHPRLEVIYETLASHHQVEMERLQDFLGVEREATRPQTHPQAHQPLSKAIANYAELKARFSQTPWAEFFED
jgi:LPS sulfotransferase NodH